MTSMSLNCLTFTKRSPNLYRYVLITVPMAEMAISVLLFVGYRLVRKPRAVTSYNWHLINNLSQARTNRPKNWTLSHLASELCTFLGPVLMVKS